MRTIGVITTSRADYGIYRSVLDAIQAAPDMRLWLFVTGMHLAPGFGQTRDIVLRDGFEIAEQVEMLLASDTPEAIAKSMGLGVIGFAQAYARHRPDLLLALGDRFEMFAAVAAALPFTIPVGHIHGGETTEGAIDESLRHAITKMSHLHFVATEEYGRRLVRMGESPWRVVVSGAPGLDCLRSIDFLSADQFHERFGVRPDRSTLLVTFHPATLEYEQAERQAGELLAALEACGQPVLFTAPNADTHGRAVRRMMEDFVRAHRQATLVANLGTQAYFSVMRLVGAMVGNSSSGIIEAASFKLPVVNVGTRQRGRARGANVIDAECRRADILRAIGEAVAPGFRARLETLVNPYDRGGAAERIVECLRTAPLGDSLVRKPFHDEAA